MATRCRSTSSWAISRPRETCRATESSSSSCSRAGVDWARPYLRRPDKMHSVMDPSLEGSYSDEAAAKAAMVAYNCLHIVPRTCPTMREVIDALEPLLSTRGDVPAGTFVYTAPPVDVADRSEVDKKGCSSEATTMKKMAVQRVVRHH
ncbi:hypothetical protein ACQ4PT_026373 [Festuca glaucescens]